MLLMSKYYIRVRNHLEHRFLHLFTTLVEYVDPENTCCYVRDSTNLNEPKKLSMRWYLWRNVRNLVTTSREVSNRRLQEEKKPFSKDKSSTEMGRIVPPGFEDDVGLRSPPFSIGKITQRVTQNSSNYHWSGTLLAFNMPDIDRSYTFRQITIWYCTEWILAGSSHSIFLFHCRQTVSQPRKNSPVETPKGLSGLAKKSENPGFIMFYLQYAGVPNRCRVAKKVKQWE